jgi:ABC-type dipeptide/oligopeptide/nickel transport system permease component
MAASRRIAARLLGAAGAVFGASIISFIFLRLAPGDPARLVVGANAPESAVRALQDQMGLNQPIYEQYWRYVSDFFQGDWGFSYSNGTSVSKLFSERIPASIELGLCAFVLAVILAVTFSLVATYRPRKSTNRALQGFTYLGLGTPPFWLGLLALIIFFETFHILPGPEGQLPPDVAPPPSVTNFVLVDSVLAGDWSTLWDAMVHLILPVTVLALAPAAYLTRLLHSNLVEVSEEPFLTTVRSKGVSRWKTAFRHALPNAALPTLTAAGPVFAELLVGSVFVETVFNWPGIGQLTVQSILRQDYSVVETFVLLSATVYVALNLLIDVLATVLDPRVRAPSAVQ